MTDVLQIVDSTLAVADQVVQTVEVGYIAQTVAQGGGAVTSVNGHTGAVVLGATDVGADASGAASSALVTAEAYTDTKIATVIPKSLVTAKGDLIAASATSTPARLAVGSDGQALVADSTQTAGLRWGSAGDRNVFPLSHYGLVAATGDPNEFQRPGNVATNDRYIARMFIPAGVPFTKLWIAVTTGGTWDGTSGPNQVVLFDDTGLQVTATPDTGTMWATAGWRGGVLGLNQGAQSTDRYVYVLAIIRGVTGCQIAFPNSGTDNGPWFAAGPGQSKRRGIYTAGSTVPASFDPTSFGAASSYIPLIGAQ